MAVDSIQKLREMEQRLSRPEFRGVPMGAALAQSLVCELYHQAHPWNVRHAVKDWTRFFYHHLCSQKGLKGNVDFCRERVLLTCITPHFRHVDMVLPIAEQLGYDRCALLYGKPRIADLLPRGLMGIDAIQAGNCQDRRAWRRDYSRFWPAMRPILKQLVREFDLPRGVYYRLADALVTCTQWVVGYQDFLRHARPAAILTEYDRNDLWAPLVLSARTLGIPTYTLMHGVMGDDCLGFYPLLADKIFCWGEISADALAAKGVERNRILIGGCSRLTRDLPLSPAEARVKMGLDPERPVVMLATQNFSWRGRLQQAEAFCRAASESKIFSGIVRLHPVDELQGYADLIARCPTVRFLKNEEYSLEDSMAAADVAIVHSSGFGSDALVKQRLTVVLDACCEPLQHGRDLVEMAGAPRATSAETLADILGRLLSDPEERDERRRLAEIYVQKFCAHFGKASAKHIAEYVLNDANTEKNGQVTS